MFASSPAPQFFAEAHQAKASVRKLTKLRKFFAEAHQAKASDN